MSNFIRIVYTQTKIVKNCQKLTKIDKNWQKVSISDMHITKSDKIRKKFVGKFCRKLIFVKFCQKMSDKNLYLWYRVPISNIQSVITVFTRIFQKFQKFDKESGNSVFLHRNTHFLGEHVLLHKIWQNL